MHIRSNVDTFIFWTESAVVVVCCRMRRNEVNTVNYSNCAWLVISVFVLVSRCAFLFVYIFDFRCHHSTFIFHVICVAFVYSALEWKFDCRIPPPLKRNIAHLRRFAVLDNIWLMSNPSFICANPAVNLNISAQQYSFILCARKFFIFVLFIAPQKTQDLQKTLRLPYERRLALF